MGAICFALARIVPSMAWAAVVALHDWLEYRLEKQRIELLSAGIDRGDR